MTLGSLPSDASQESNLIVATDFHPLVLENLRKNLDLNFDRAESGGDEADVWIGKSGSKVWMRPLDWLFFHRDPDQLVTVGRDGVRNKEDVGDSSSLVEGSLEPPFNERFDVIFGGQSPYPC